MCARERGASGAAGSYLRRSRHSRDRGTGRVSPRRPQLVHALSLFLAPRMHPAPAAASGRGCTSPRASPREPPRALRPARLSSPSPSRPVPLARARAGSSLARPRPRRIRRKRKKGIKSDACRLFARPRPLPPPRPSSSRVLAPRTTNSKKMKETRGKKGNEREGNNEKKKGNKGDKKERTRTVICILIRRRMHPYKGETSATALQRARWSVVSEL
ncbi:hypothetical protein C8R47DRAFT_1240925 [Mycena vitilis]|nr:hypothetical protein C8R47DRAFT_1240925 [Mycena vitilis]